MFRGWQLDYDRNSVGPGSKLRRCPMATLFVTLEYVGSRAYLACRICNAAVRYMRCVQPTRQLIVDLHQLLPGTSSDRDTSQSDY